MVAIGLCKVIICCLGSILIIGCVLLGLLRAGRPNPVTFSADPCNLAELPETGTIRRSKQLAKSMSVNLEWDLSVELSLKALEISRIPRLSMISFESHAELANELYGKVSF